MGEKLRNALQKENYIQCAESKNPTQLRIKRITGFANINVRWDAIVFTTRETGSNF